MNLDRIHHITIQVANLELAVQWYTSSFSCEVVYRDNKEAILRFANVQLTLALPSIQQRHVAFVREDAATLGELREQSDGSRTTMLSDPSGNIVEVVERSSLDEE